MALLLAALANLLEEDMVLLSRCGNTLPERVHCSTPRRWAHQGVRGVYLETIHVGGRVYTSRQALARFFAALTASRVGRREEPSPPAKRESERKAVAAVRAGAIFGPTPRREQTPHAGVDGQDRSRKQ